MEKRPEATQGQIGRKKLRLDCALYTCSAIAKGSALRTMA